MNEGNWSEQISPAPKHHLQLILNTHNFKGIDNCQPSYHRIKQEAGVSVKNGKAIGFNTSDYPLMVSAFKHLLSKDAAGPGTAGSRPDWWWTDGALKQWDESTGVNTQPGNLFFHTHLHSNAIRYGADAARNRPVVMGRFAGIGQHRYCCGFSGDANSSWVTLQAEVNMTKTAANVLFGYWSHDIGGFRGGSPKTGEPNPSGEMYLRWMQFGAVSPLFRTHGILGSERRPWVFDTFPLMREAMALRATLSPLLYTLSAEAYTTAIAPVRPLYYDYPEYDTSYAEVFEYQLGASVIVRPVVDPIANGSDSTTVQVWLPPSANGWVDWNASTVVPPAQTPTSIVSVDATLATLPMFVKAGAVLPLLPLGALDVTVTDSIVWALFPGAAEGGGTRYFDDGTSTEYESSGGSWQNFSYAWSEDKASLECHIVAAESVAAQQDVAAGNAGAESLGSTPMLYSIELRRSVGSAVPKAAAFNGVAGTIAVTKQHSLARPAGTVVIQAAGRFPVDAAVNVTVTF